MSYDTELNCLQAYAACIKIPVGKLAEHDVPAAARIINKMSFLLEESLFILSRTVDPATQQNLAAKELDLLWERLIVTALTPSPDTTAIGNAQLKLMRLSRPLDRRKLPERYAMILAFMPDEQVKQQAYDFFENLAA